MTIIITKRLRLIPYKWATDDSHLLMMTKWLNDSDVVKYSEQRHERPHTLESQMHYIANGPREFREIHTSDAFIGTIAAHVDENNSVANVGILIGEKEKWGKGYGAEAWQAFCDHLLNNGIYKIEAGCMSPNTAMVNIFKKSGMYKEGYRDQHFKFNNGRADLEQWAKFNV